MVVHDYTCPHCSAGIKVPRNTDRTKCEYCGQEFIVEGNTEKKKKDIRITVGLICSVLLTIFFMSSETSILALVFSISSVVLGVIELKRKSSVGYLGIVAGGVFILLVIFNIVVLFGERGQSPELVFEEAAVWNQQAFYVQTEESIINKVMDMDSVIDVEAVNSANDPNGLLGEKDGYIASIYFSVNSVDQDSVYGNSVVDKGVSAGGNIEIYRNEKDAKKRIEHLKSVSFTGSGGYGYIGNVVIRTSPILTPFNQQELANRIIDVIQN